MRKRILWSGLAGLLAGLVVGPAIAAEPAVMAGGDNLNPPVLPQSGEMPKGTLYRQPMTAVAPPHGGRERVYDLKIAYIKNQIRNPAAGHPDPVCLRGYQGTGTNPNLPYIAPTIEAGPGDTVRVRLDNQLIQDKSCSTAILSPEDQKVFNSTNLHSHGLWVSPTGNSDNVLLTINPGVKFEYEYNIPEDHPAGTFWYHPHRHGSTAVQVGSGMAGALIIRGERPPTLASNGDLDTLLKPFKERLLVFEQIPYACLKDGKLKYKTVAQKQPDGTVKDVQVIDWSCAPGEVGEIVSLEQFAPSAWTDSGRFTTVNGRVRPVFANATVGQTERWRLIHAGVRQTIDVEFRKLDAASFLNREAGMSAAGEDRFVTDFCKGEPVPYVTAAADGLTMAQGQVQRHTTLQPGYRNDLLVAFPEDGFYCVVDREIAPADNINGLGKSRSVLGFVRVRKDQGGVTVKDPIARITSQLIASASSAYRATPAVARLVIDDLKDGLKLTKFTPHRPIADAETAGQPVQKLAFFINLGPGGNGPTTFDVANDFKVVKGADGVYAPAGAKPYDPATVDRQLVLGTAQEWQLTSYFVSHPFHIHVNPFEIISVIGPDGRDLSKPGATEKVTKQINGQTVTVDELSQYAGLKGVWKDTLWVKSNITAPLPSDVTPPVGSYLITVRTRYERYIGEFVLHCHILDHEDQGMMQNVSIGLPDGHGGMAGSAHQH